MNRILFIVLAAFVSLPAFAQRDFSASEITKVVMLGTGNPNPNPFQSGTSVAIVVRNTPYIVDFGPGLVRQAARLSPRYGGNIKALDVKNIKHAFLTHLHSDHTTGYPDLILTPWVMGRDEPLLVFGPEGLNKMTTKILEAYEDDIKYRLYGDEPANNEGWRVDSNEIWEEGEIYQDGNVRVEAFPVPHGSWPNAWGFRFTTPDKTIVISGDTAPSEKLIKYARNCDILIHEVYCHKKWEERNDFWRAYHQKNHTSTYELGEIAKAAKPKMVVLNHILFWGATEEEMLEEISSKYDGKVMVAKDLDVY